MDIPTKELFPRRPTRIEVKSYVPVPPPIPEPSVSSLTGYNPPIHDRERLCGTLEARPEASKVPYAFYLAIDESFTSIGGIITSTNNPIVYESINGEWVVRSSLNPVDILGNIEGEEAKISKSYDSIGWVYTCTDTGNLFEGFEHGWFRLNDPSSNKAKLRSSLSSQFGIRLESTGARAITDSLTRVIMQTLDASPENPYLVTFDQFILDPFTGPGQFDLVERDSIRRVFDGTSAGGTPVLGSETMNWQPGDADKIIQVGLHPGRFYKIVSVEDPEHITLSANITLPSIELTLTMDGEIEETIATKSGFSDGAAPTTSGWSRLAKVITDDKVYSVIFVPGTAGDGIFSASARALYGGFIDPDQTPLPT